MNDKIAVLLNDEGKTVGFDVGGLIQVYMKEKEGWQVTEPFAFVLDRKGGLKGIRQQMRDLVLRLGDCTILVAEKIFGIPYNILDANGFSLWEIKGKPMAFLEDVMTEEASPMEDQDTSLDKGPEKTAVEGSYYFDMKAAIAVGKGTASTKQLLMPFLQNELFFELELVCDHVPKWFEKDFDKLQLTYERLRSDDNEEVLMIKHATCKTN